MSIIVELILPLYHLFLFNSFFEINVIPHSFDKFRLNDCEECENVPIRLIILKRTIMLSFDGVSWL
jgi:hypothetical protein